ncbi:DM13 domain-containing protein [Actinopolymorpha sp. B11F2]|uniref:DM13 domain-containing protein n=1 Tax=Actinopolymorpha sp. B11F2 TaxID=3160862 RepID=UPI0032E3AF7F
MTRRKQSFWRRRRGVLTVVTVLVTAAVAGGLVAFEPWRLFTSSTVNEEIPVSVAEEAATPTVRSTAPSPTRSASATPSPIGTASASASPTPDDTPAGPRELASGRFVTQEHETTGTARILRLAGGERYLRLDSFSTSDGPDLHVWITDQAAGGSWGKYDDGRFLRLGELKATDGNQNYRIPADADLAGLRSVVIWCDRFNVAFGSAPLES